MELGLSKNSVRLGDRPIRIKLLISQLLLRQNKYLCPLFQTPREKTPSEYLKTGNCLNFEFLSFCFNFFTLWCLGLFFRGWDQILSERRRDAVWVTLQAQSYNMPLQPATRSLQDEFQPANVFKTLTGIKIQFKCKRMIQF